MANLKGTKTHGNLKYAFAGESQANRRYLYFAKQADVEGYPEVAGNFRDTAEARPATPTATSTTSGWWATRPPTSPSATA
jgi:rubrerythrin